MDVLRENIRSFLRFSPTDYSVEVRWLSREEGNGFARSLIRYTAADGEPIEAFLLEPTARESCGAVLALHQHNSQWEIGKSEIAGLRGDPMQAFGPALACRGITVLAPDAVGFESRMNTAGWGQSLAPALNKPQSTAEGWLQYYNQVTYRLVRGDLLMRKLLADCGTALSLLHQYTGTTHMGVIGHSFGGNVALFLAALDARVAYACASGAIGSYRQKMAAGTALEGALIIPGFAGQYDLDDLFDACHLASC
jgi:dienelactone hydrolase